MQAISCNAKIEKVTFEFEKQISQEDQSKLCMLILEQCGCLEELEVKVKLPAYKGNEMFRNMTRSFEFPPAMKLKIITVDISSFNEADAIGFSIFLLNLPNLEEIITLGETYCLTFVVYEKILTGICEYLINFKTALKLKKLQLKKILQFNEKLALLLTLCEKFQIMVPKLSTDFNTLLNLAESSILNQFLLQKQQRIMFATHFAGLLLISSSISLTNLERLNALKIIYLALYFKRNIMGGELNFLKHMKDMETLELKGIPYENFSVASSTEWDNALSAGLPSLMTLKFKYDILDSFRVFWLPQYFPNLKKLEIANCKCTTNDLIWQLSSMASLTDLTLDELNNLEDTAFIMVCRTQCEKEGETSLMMPAIAGFNDLNILSIKYCAKLTDDCVINGIARCKTLKKLTVIDCKGITDKSCEYVSCEIEFPSA